MTSEKKTVQQHGKTSPVLQDFYEMQALNPWCPHGPTLKFERSSKVFYACSAFRQRKDCNAYFTTDETPSSPRWFRWRKILEESFVGKEPMKIRLDNVSHFCQSCNQLAVDKSSHKGHDSVVAVTRDQLRFPSRLLTVLDSSKKEAQFHFDPETLDVIYGALRANKVKRVVCLGAPSVHEHIKAKCDKIESILIDIDQRLEQFYPRGEDHPGEFSHYNMFNNYFFDADSRRAFKEFVQRCGSRGVTVITDPPFGGKCELIGRTLGHLKKEFSEALRVDFVWVFPYFMEPQILGTQLSLAMSDYQVRYQKGAKYKDGTGKGRSAGSPVRLFTSFKLSTLDLSAVRGKLIFLCTN